MSKRMTETQIVSILKEAEAGISAKELCRKYGIASSTVTLPNLRPPCVRIVVTPNNQVKGGNKEQRCPGTVKRENKLY